jgi:hypothetical protein
MLDIDQMFLIAIPHTPIIRWQPNFFNRQESRACHMVLESLQKGFQNDGTS